MHSKKLCLADGIVGLIFGIILLFGGFIVTGGAIADVANNTNGVGATGGAVIALDILKAIVLILGIVTMVIYKGDDRVSLAPSVLFVVGGGVALIPFLGWVGAIIVIVGGSLYLARLKYFKQNND